MEPRMERRYGSDYASFNEVDVPGFFCIGDESDYNQTHHTQADTFDEVQAEGIIQAAAKELELRVLLDPSTSTPVVRPHKTKTAKARGPSRRIYRNVPALIAL